MKKVFFVSLLLVSLFLIGSSGVASAQECTDYECSWITTCDGEVDSIDYGWCIELCTDGFEFYATDYDWYEAWLYPAPDDKHLLGTADTDYDWAGYSIEFKGRSLIGIFSFIQEDEGCVEVDHCVPSTNCSYGP